MARSYIAFPLALLLSASPILSFFVALICCCDDDLPGFHIHNGQHGYRDVDHVEGHGPEASDESAEHHQDLHQSHDTYQLFDSQSMADASSPGSSSSPCVCSAADLPARQELALLKASEIDRTLRNLAVGHLALATQVRPKRLHVGIYATSTRDVCPAGPGLYVINHSLLI